MFWEFLKLETESEVLKVGVEAQSGISISVSITHIHIHKSKSQSQILNLNAVLQKQRMQPPASAPKPVQQLMLHCWAHKSSARPTTSQARDILGELVDDFGSDYSS